MTEHAFVISNEIRASFFSLQGVFEVLKITPDPNEYPEVMRILNEL